MSNQVVVVNPQEFQKELIDYIKCQFQKLEQKIVQNNSDELLTREETADFLKVNKSTLWSWHKQGKLTPSGIGKRVYYKRSDIENALKPLKH